MYKQNAIEAVAKSDKVLQSQIMQLREEIAKLSRQLNEKEL